jgi:peptidoglycan/xylan/chitin deacetylase (PgdA/CDA1 family)
MIAILLLNAALIAQQREIAVTFDDLPFVTVGGSTKDIVPYRTWTTSLLKKLTDQKIKAAGFVNAGKLFDGDRENKELTSLLRMWLDNGCELGNHTYAHKDFHRVSWPEFREDVIKGESVLKQLLRERGLKLRYFRHPLLHTGNTPQLRKKLDILLAERGYTVAPVTIDNSEWIFARAYHNVLKRKNREQLGRIVDAYISYMEKKLQYYEQQSTALFGREIKQVLLLHANELNADHFHRLARMIKKRGYTFITLNHALTDPAYKSADTYTGRGGISWIHRWAISKGKKGDFFKGESEAPEFIMKLANARYE